MGEQPSGQQEILNRVYRGPKKTGDTVDVLSVLPFAFDNATGSLERGGLAVTQRYDYSSSTTIYTAQAALGTSESSTGWTITQYDLTDSSDATALVATDVSWTDRAMGTYS